MDDLRPANEHDNGDRTEHDVAYRVHQELTLELHADVADWNPNSGLERLLAVGTYELDEETRQRHGKLYTYELDLQYDIKETAESMSTTQNMSTSSASLRLVHTADKLPGIFDLQFIPSSPSNAANTSSVLVALALADGSVRIMDAWSGGEVARCGETDVDDTQAMALFVDALVSPASTRLTTSYSDGTIHVLDATPDGRLVQTHCWEAHSLEAWMATWSRAPCRRGNIIFSGGDDAIFQAWDIRETQGDTAPARQFLDRKTHGAGVTCITEVLGTDGAHDTTVLTGSYDNMIRLWDWRNTSRPILQTSFDMGGGVWRIKPHPSDPSILLAATMYDGFKIVSVDSAGGTIDSRSGWNIHSRLEFPPKHKKTDKTLAYGASWCRDPQAIGLAATCSFYDNLLSLWSWTNDTTTRE